MTERQPPRAAWPRQILFQTAAIASPVPAAVRYGPASCARDSLSTAISLTPSPKRLDSCFTSATTSPRSATLIQVRTEPGHGHLPVTAENVTIERGCDIGLGRQPPFGDAGPAQPATQGRDPPVDQDILALELPADPV